MRRIFQKHVVVIIMIIILICIVSSFALYYMIKAKPRSFEIQVCTAELMESENNYGNP